MTCKSTKRKEKPAKLRHLFLCKVFQAWRSVVQLNVKDKSNNVEMLAPNSAISTGKTLIPGVAGLRNLGNTCYMNSILQVLGHLDKFRHFFVSMPARSLTSAHSCCHNQITANITQNSTNSRNTTADSLQLLRKCPLKGGGLNGGGTQQKPLPSKLWSLSPTTSHHNHKLAKCDKSVSLCEELRSLFQALWSGQSSVISPNALLQAVWDYVPAFQGYSQQDAQEFLSELLDKVQAEMKHLGYIKKYQDVVTDTFQGELVSEITCLSCEQKFQTYEPFMDLSLEFPSRYQRKSPNWKIANNVCHITEMLSHFTKSERLEGRIYACASCNGKRRSSCSSKIYTKIRKQFLLSKLPHVLRLHLKRFRWSKGNHREKIATHVSFDKFLNVEQFCAKSMTSQQSQRLYQLSAIIIHHGKGFGSGHYTAFCWSKEADSWIHCNDTSVQQVPTKEVFKSQVYILIFSLLNSTQEPPKDFTPTTTITTTTTAAMETTDSSSSSSFAARDSFSHKPPSTSEEISKHPNTPATSPAATTTTTTTTAAAATTKTAVKSSSHPAKTTARQYSGAPWLIYFESPYYTRSKSHKRRKARVKQTASSVVRSSSSSSNRKRKHKCNGSNSKRRKHNTV